MLSEERATHVQKTKEKLASLPRSNKQWWRLNRQLLRRKVHIGSIPNLRDGVNWVSDPKTKADAFANVFKSKAKLPEECVDTPFFGAPPDDSEQFVAFRSRSTRRLFKKLDESKATGNDKISAAILKRLHDCIAVPFTKVVRRLFYEGCWPEMWKFHVIVPIYKKGSAFLPGNYRGVHLTSVLSKVAEKLIGLHLVPLLKRTAFGTTQWAFTTGLSARDLITMLVMDWVLAVCMGKKIGGYLSDISGAFDRVCKEYLLAKLHGYGVGTDFLNFLDAYLSPRVGQVVVHGARSELMEIANSVFQGTVLGPPLWNIFFADVGTSASSTGGAEHKFADDLNVFQEFDQHEPLENINSNLALCRKRVHKWGSTNRVSFDVSKEHIVVMHPSRSWCCFQVVGMYDGHGFAHAFMY